MIIKNKKNEQFIIFYDDDDHELISLYKWYVTRAGDLLYVQSKSFHKYTYMHRLIMNAKKCEEIDHRFGNGLDNQKKNLRKCTHAENQCNKKASGISKYLGVSFHSGRWRAKIKKNGIETHIGHFKIEKNAALAYNEMALKIHGEFARLNIV